MSYFLFGTFDTMHDNAVLKKVKELGEEKNIYIWFNEEIIFYEEIQRMLMEQKAEGKIKFAITSKLQPSNSCDVLFPFDKFTNEALFADETRSFYKECCRDNIDILFEFLNDLIKLLNIVQVVMFVVEGYDDTFHQKVCTIDDMKNDLLYQVENKVSIDSCIYCVS